MRLVAVITALALVPLAHAEDFTGRIKRVRIQDRDQTHLVEAVTGPASSATFVVAQAGGEPVTVDVGAPTSTSASGAAALNLPPHRWTHVAVSHRSGQLRALGGGGRVDVDVPVCASDCDDAPVARTELPDGSSVALQIDLEDEPVLRLAVDGPAALGRGFQFQSTGQGPGLVATLPAHDLDVTNTWEAELPEGALRTGFTTGEVTTYDARDGVVEQLSAAGMVYGDEPAPDGLHTFDADVDGAELWTLNAPAEPLEVTASSGETLFKGFPEPIADLRVMESKEMKFADDPTGFAYNAVATVWGREGEWLGEEHITLMAGEVVEGTGLLHKATLVHTGEGGWTVAASVDGGVSLDTYDIELTFEEPFEGPPPQENPIDWDLRPVADWTGFAATWPAAAGTLSVSYDGTNFAATAGVSGFGKGTKNTASQTSGRPELL